MLPAASCGWSITEPLIVTGAAGSGGDTGSTGLAGTGSGGASTEDAGTGDAGTDEPPLPTGCTAWWGQPGWSFDAPEPLASLNSSALEADPWQSSDGLQLAFASDRPGAGGYDLYVATRLDPAEPFGPPVAQSVLNSAFDETALSWDDDGTRLFASTRGTDGLTSTLWRATAGSTPEFSPLVDLDAPGDNFDPFLAPDGQWLYWTVDAGDDAMNLRRAYRATPQAPFEAQGLSPLESDAYDDSQSLSADGRVVVWGSERPGGPGQHDLWFATRSDAEAEFGAPAAIPGVNTAVQDREVFVTADGCSLYFASDRPGGMGAWDLYVAHARLD